MQGRGTLRGMALPAAPLGVDPAHPLDLRVERDGELAVPSRVWRQLRRNLTFWIGLVVATLILGLALGADWLAPYDPDLAIRGGRA